MAEGFAPLPLIDEQPNAIPRGDDQGTNYSGSPAVSPSQSADSPPGSLLTSDPGDENENISDEAISWDHVPVFDCTSHPFSSPSSISLGISTSSSSSASTQSISPANTDGSELIDDASLGECFFDLLSTFDALRSSKFL